MGNCIWKVTKVYVINRTLVCIEPDVKRTHSVIVVESKNTAINFIRNAVKGFEHDPNKSYRTTIDFKDNGDCEIALGTGKTGSDEHTPIGKIIYTIEESTLYKKK